MAPGTIRRIAILPLVLLAGCVSFGGRGVLPEHAGTLSIPMLRNQTLEPGVEEPATAALEDRFQTDGRLELVSRDRADLVLTGEVTHYRLHSVGYDRSERVSTANVEVGVELSLYDAAADRYIFQDRLFQESGIYYRGITPSDRRRRDVFIRLANSVRDAVIEDW